MSVPALAPLARFSYALLLGLTVLALPTAIPRALAQVDGPNIAAAPLFTDAARARIVAYWNAPGRYEIGARPDARKTGVYTARLTPDASRWLGGFNRALRPKNPAHTEGAVEFTAATRAWESWVAAKLKFDRAVVTQQADAANAALFAAPLAPLPDALAPLPDPPATAPTLLAELPPHPGPIPADLLASVGNPPPFAALAVPQHYTVRFENGESISYTDNLAPANPRNAYLRFAEGVAAFGTPLSKIAPTELEAIFAASDLSPQEGRVMRAVSLLEGGFDSINTYDTGFVSVGFIQFAALEEGSGSLGDVLKHQKNRDPLVYKRDFQDYGVDVTPDGILVVIDPASGAELKGNAAALKIIADKRLTAVFHLAGQRSTAFRAAQIHVAKANYYPADDTVSVAINNRNVTARVGDVIRSEAGLATLFDRKVNTGNIRALGAILQKLMLEKGLTSLEQTRPFEREIIAAVRWRSDFLKDATLTQPQ